MSTQYPTEREEFQWVLNDIRAEQSKPTVEPEPCVWRDISTAPKDGTEVLLLWHDAETGAAPMHRVGSWHSREQAWCDTHRVLHNQQSPPTHWTPLPGAPLKVER